MKQPGQLSNSWALRGRGQISTTGNLSIMAGNHQSIRSSWWWPSDKHCPPGGHQCGGCPPHLHKVHLCRKKLLKSTVTIRLLTPLYWEAYQARRVTTACCPLEGNYIYLVNNITLLSTKWCPLLFTLLHVICPGVHIFFHHWLGWFCIGK